MLPNSREEQENETQPMADVYLDNYASDGQEIQEMWEMTSRPITLSPDQVRAALDGLLSQVRIPIRLKFNPEHLMVMPLCSSLPGVLRNGEKLEDANPNHERRLKRTGWMTCPFGIVGDRLWVREKCRMVDFSSLGDGVFTHTVEYVDGKRGPYNRGGTELMDTAIGWRSPVAMPRWASRITLELTGVRVEKDGEQWCWVLDVKRVGQGETK